MGFLPLIPVLGVGAAAFLSYNSYLLPTSMKQFFKNLQANHPKKLSFMAAGLIASPFIWHFWGVNFANTIMRTLAFRVPINELPTPYPSLLSTRFPEAPSNFTYNPLLVLEDNIAGSVLAMIFNLVHVVWYSHSIWNMLKNNTSLDRYRDSKGQEIKDPKRIEINAFLKKHSTFFCTVFLGYCGVVAFHSLFVKTEQYNHIYIYYGLFSYFSNTILNWYLPNEQHTISKNKPLMISGLEQSIYLTKDILSWGYFVSKHLLFATINITMITGGYAFKGLKCVLLPIHNMVERLSNRENESSEASRIN